MAVGVRALRAFFPLSFACLASVHALAAEPPNIVFILLDDVGYGDFGAYGGSHAETPNLDALAAEGMRFTNYHSNAPVCTPARAAILTGHYPIGLGLRKLVNPGSQRGIPPDVETLPERLRTAGYATGHFGKWHLGERPEYLPIVQGFERSAIPVEPNGDNWNRMMSIDDGPPFPLTGHITDFTTDQVLAFIEANRDRRFFANVWYNAAHAPYQPVPEWADRYPNTLSGRYAATLSHADAAIGRILAELARLDLDTRTLVLVTSDNGGVREDIPTNGPLRGRKGDLFEGGIRLPLLARWPASITAGSVNASLILGIDFLPTLCELAGVPVGAGLPGRSALPALLSGEEGVREGTFFWETADALAVYQAGASELYRYAVRRGDWKLVRNPDAGAAVPMLFDLASDPYETSDRAAEHPELVAELERSYRLWRARESQVDAPVTTVSGTAATGPWLRFSGGVVELAGDPRFGIHDGDMGFTVRVTPADTSTPQVIAAIPGSWDLVVMPGGSVRLVLRGVDGSTATLEGSAHLLPGVSSDVAFSLFAQKLGTRARLYVDSVLDAESRDLPALSFSPGPLRLGNGGVNARPFRGTLWAPRFHTASLGPSDLLDGDFDGVPNASDVCIGEPDGPLAPDAGGNVQRDSDGDGFGNACDPDVNGDGVIGTPDWLAILSAFGARAGDEHFDADLDLDGDGVVGFLDLARVARALGAPPGPSGLVCTPSAPCAVR